MKDKTQYLIDIEMQNYFYDGLDLNALSYATALKNASNLPVIVFVLLFKQSEINNSFEIMPFKKYLNEGVYKEIDDYVYVICFDLYYILQCIEKFKEPDLNGFKITEEGKNWIKLITIKEWMKAYDSKKERFPIPQELCNSKEIISAIMLLNSNDNSQIVKIIIKEKEKEILKEDIKREQLIDIWTNAFLQRLNVDIKIVPFPTVAPEFLIRTCKRNLNKTDCKLFLNYLVEKKILHFRNIYEKLINSIYKN